MIFVRGMKPWQFYANEMHNKWNFLVAWPTDQKLRLGDVGYMQDNVFNRTSSLDLLEIEYNKKTRTGKSESEEFHSAGLVEVHSKFDATAIPAEISKLGAEIVINFRKENAVFYKAPKSKVCSLDDKLTLGNTIVELYKNYRDDINHKRPVRKEWQLDWAVITDLHYAERVTIIISNEKGAYIGLNTGAGTNKIDALNLNCKLDVVSHQGIDTQILGAEGLTPLFNVLRLEETITKPLGAKRYIDSIEPGRAGYEEYQRSLPILNYEAKNVQYVPFAEASNQ